MEKRIRAGLMNSDLHYIPQPKRKELRKFGLTIGGIIGLLFGLLIPWALRRPFPLWPRVVASILVPWALAAPASLRLVYRGWMKFGSVLNRITTPVILGIIYLIVITPIGFIMRIQGKDPMARKLDKEAQSYRVPSRKIINKNMERPF